MGASFEGDALEEVARFEAEFDVHLVVGEPKGGFGDAGGPFADFDAVELVDVDACGVAFRAEVEFFAVLFEVVELIENAVF